MKQNENKLPRITFKISNVVIDEISLLPHKIELLPPKEEGFIFETSVGVNIIPEENAINVGVWIKLFTDKAKTNFLGELKVKTIFVVENLASFTVSENITRFPGIVMANFVSISISTARGVLASYTNNTPLQGAILPVQDPMFFVKQLQAPNTFNPQIAKSE